MTIIAVTIGQDAIAHACLLGPIRAPTREVLFSSYGFPEKARLAQEIDIFRPIFGLRSLSCRANSKGVGHADHRSR
jgi:hypothetical protein